MKENQLAVQLRQAADNENALFSCKKYEKVDIRFVLSEPNLEWELYVPPKPDKELYISPYGIYLTLESAKKCLAQGCTHIIKVTKNGKTDKVTAKVIEL